MFSTLASVTRCLRSVLVWSFAVSVFALNLTDFSIATETLSSSSSYLELQQLKSQMESLIVQRRDDFTKLEAMVRNSLSKDVEIDQLRNELRDVKMQLDSMKASSYSKDCDGNGDGGVAVDDGAAGGGQEAGAAARGCAGNRVKNERLTIDWLSNSVAEIRAEIAELVKSFDSTAVSQQQRQLISTDISILQNDVVSLRHEVEHAKANAAKCDAKLDVFALDVDAFKQSTSSLAAKLINVTEQIRIISTNDWSSVLAMALTKPLKRNKHKSVFKKMIVLNENPLEMRVFTTTQRRRDDDRYERRRRRRRRRRKSEFSKHLRYSNKNKDDDDDNDNDDPVGQQLSAAKEVHPSNASASSSATVASLEKRLQKLETVADRVLEITSPNRGGLDKLRTSMLELLESVENVEAKFDNVTPVLRKEISKIEFAVAQIIANLSVAQQAQKNDRSFVATVAENLAKTQSEFDRYEYHLSVVDEKFERFLALFNSCSSVAVQQNSAESWMFASSSSPSSSSSSSSSSPPSPSLSAELPWQGNRRLPEDCEEATVGGGASGLYLLLLADDAMPILVFCETNSSNANIVIQRRTDGELDFNRSWQEYVAGFGNLKGEFWLGNEIIHRLTKNNDTGLRIEFEDLAGQQWYAEYETFGIASGQQAYKLHVDGFSGNATNAFQHHNGMPFSTRDSDHDISDTTNCAADYESGWWYSHCQHANLNVKYSLGLNWLDANRNQWIAVSSTKMTLIRRRRDSSLHRFLLER